MGKSGGGWEEARIIGQICTEIRKAKKIEPGEEARLREFFKERYDNAIGLVKAKKVSKYIFKPSGKVSWVVEGRTRNYEVMPESQFCNCDDYFFRVMERKKAVCYHILAQKIADALESYASFDEADVNYDRVSRRWRQLPRSVRRKRL